MKRVNYLNNRDLLKQIHLSKNTYCSYVAPEDNEYDIIVTDVKKIKGPAIALARKARAKRLTQQAWETAKAEGGRKKNKLKMSDFEVSTRKINKTDLVFRVMPSNHKKKTNKQGCVPIVAANLQSHGLVGIEPQLTSDTKSNSPCVSQKNTSLLGMKTSSLLEITQGFKIPCKA